MAPKNWRFRSMTMIKRRIFINYEKEEKWLNEMAQKGYHLVKYSLTKYTFEEGEAGKYIYLIQYVGNNTDEENEEYFQIMKDSNVELITYAMNWAIFRKKTEDGPFNIFSDYASKIQHYYSISKMLGILTLVNLFLAFLNISFQTKLNIFVSIFSFSVVLLMLVTMGYYLKQAKKLSAKKENL